ARKAQSLKSLREHIGGFEARCFQCNFIFADYKEYFTHLTAFTHLQKKMIDAVTVIYNLEHAHQEESELILDSVPHMYIFI
ncbi:hypothetical protein PMAYCL1PPCAC_00558, partial [Pristionchus mayeri]